MAAEHSDRSGVVIRFEGSISVPEAPSDAFRLADMSNLADWNPAVRTAELVSGEALTVGARFRCVVANGPARVTAHPVLERIEPNRLVTYSGRFGPARSEDTIRFEPEGTGTRLTFTNVSTLPRWMRPLRALITRPFHRQAWKAVAGANRYLAAACDRPS